MKHLFYENAPEEATEAKKAKTSIDDFFDAISSFHHQLKGGKADGKKPNEFDPEELYLGWIVEKEHAKDPSLRLEIAMGHLVEDPKYYRHSIFSDEVKQALVDWSAHKKQQEAMEEAKKKRRRKMALGPFYGKMGGKSAATMPPFRSSGEGVNPTSPGPAHPGAGGINAPGVPGGANSGTGPA